MSDVRRDANAVLLPISDSFDESEWLVSFLRSGGRSVLVASSAEEYAARRISDARRAVETPELIQGYAATVTKIAGKPVLVAVDAEPTGVQRLEHLLPTLPTRAEIGLLSDTELAAAFGDYAKAARSLGVTLFLSPVVDEITGQNPWLQGRIMADDLDDISRIGASYVTAVQQQGILATAKHFPGHSDLSANPVHEDVVLAIPADHVECNYAPFMKLIDAGVTAIMVGPVTVEAIDPEQPAATSPTVIGVLRNQLAFTGLIISDDLDAASTLRGRSLGDAAVAAIDAGVQLLLIPGAEAVAEIANALVEAVENGRLSDEKLFVAARAVSDLADASGSHTDEI